MQVQVKRRSDFVFLVPVKRLSCLFAVGLIGLASPTNAFRSEETASPAAVLRYLAEQDRLVARVGHRLATANASLCPRRFRSAGIAIHTLSQYNGPYRAAAAKEFGLGSYPGVLAVIADSPADMSGLREGDELVSIDGRDLAPLNETPASDQADRVLDVIDEAMSDGEARFVGQRGPNTLAFMITGTQACQSRFAVVSEAGVTASADGDYVRVSTPMLAFIRNENELAVLLAHEFAHNILRHAARLDAQKVPRSLLGQFGRNAQRIRVTEIEADRLSVYLLANAGYDATLAPAFWDRLIRAHGGGIFASPTHPGRRERLQLLVDELARVELLPEVGELLLPPPELMPRP